MVTVNQTQLGSGYKPYVIAEVGINAGSDVELAKSFIDTAAEAGADAVKFQIHLPDEEMVEEEMDAIGNHEVYEVVSSCSFSKDDHRELKQHCEQQDVEYLSTPFSAKAVEWLVDLGVSAIKIGSGELTNFEMLQKAASVGVPLLVSTGMSNYESIRSTVRFLNEEDAEFALLYCVSEYPTNPVDFELDTISEMKSRYEVPVGFSDHSTGIEASVIAMAKGADFVEKHFTIDRRLPGPDQEVSIEPEQLTELCKYATLIDETSGAEKSTTDAEAEVKQWARHSIVTTERLNAGTELKEEHLTTKRPGTGIPAEKFYDTVGSTLAKDVDENTVLRESDLSES